MTTEIKFEFNEKTSTKWIEFDGMKVNNLIYLTHVFDHLSDKLKYRGVLSLAEILDTLGMKVMAEDYGIVWTEGDELKVDIWKESSNLNEFTIKLVKESNR